MLGESAILLGGHSRKKALDEKIKAVLTQLRDEVGAAVYFSRYDEGEVRIIDYADGPSAPRVNEWVDFRYAAHASAVGKCLLTQLDRDERREHVSRHKVARFTSKTITNEKVLFNTLDSQPPDGPHPRPPGVRGGHGVRRGAGDGGRHGRLPGRLHAAGAGAPAAYGGRHPQQALGVGAAVHGDLTSGNG